MPFNQLEIDYYNTLLANETGRRVYYDLKQMAVMWFRSPGEEKGRSLTPEESAAKCVLYEFIMRIDEKCGLNSPDAELKMLAGQATIAAAALHDSNEDIEKLNLHETD